MSNTFTAIIATYGTPNEHGDIPSEQEALRLFDTLRQQIARDAEDAAKPRLIDVSMEGDKMQGRIIGTYEGAAFSVTKATDTDKLNERLQQFFERDVQDIENQRVALQERHNHVPVLLQRVSELTGIEQETLLQCVSRTHNTNVNVPWYQVLSILRDVYVSKGPVGKGGEKVMNQYHEQEDTAIDLMGTITRSTIKLVSSISILWLSEAPQANAREKAIEALANAQNALNRVRDALAHDAEAPHTYDTFEAFYQDVMAGEVDTKKLMLHTESLQDFYVLDHAQDEKEIVEGDERDVLPMFWRSLGFKEWEEN